MKQHLTKASAIAILIAATTAIPSQSFAQNSDATADRGDTIIVTARKRAESIQDVPLAITAFNSESIARRGIQELEDVARFTAGFAFEDFDGGNGSPVIRGQSTLRATGREQTVATFLDGVYMPRSWLVDLGVSNLERVEVVKGPQGARYGRNAFAGALNFISKKAGDRSAEASVTVGSDERLDLGAAVSIPLFPDKLSVRGAYDRSEFDGSWENDHPNANAGVEGGTNGNVGGYDNESWSVNLMFTPNDRFEIDATLYRFDKEEEARAANWLNTGLDGTAPVGSRAGTADGNCGAQQARSALEFNTITAENVIRAGMGMDLLPIPTVSSLFCGEYPPPSDTVEMDPRGFGRQANVDIFRASASFDLTESLEISYLFGKVDANTLSANTAESDTVNCGTILGPQAGSPFFPSALCNFQGSPRGQVDYKQHELRLTFDNSGPLRGAFGVFKLDGSDKAQSASINEAPLSTSPLGNGFTFRNEETLTDVWAIFGEAEYDLGQTRIGVEARYTTEEITDIDLRNRRVPRTSEFTFFTPKVTVEHDLNDDTLLYVSAGRGAKAGGFNTSALTPELADYDPEFNWTYEVGAKNTIMNGNGVVNIAAFYTDWSAMQVALTDPLAGPLTTPVTTNQGDTTVYGVELEGSLQATDNLSFDVALSYTDATFNDGTLDQQISSGAFSAAYGNPCDDVVCNISGDIGGNDLPRSPSTQAAFGAQWEGQISSDMDYYIRGDGAYQSRFFADTINAAIIRDRTIFNASAGIRGDNYDLSIWARNLGDNKYVSNSLQIIQAQSNNILGSYFGERRTIGATLKVNID